LRPSRAGCGSTAFGEDVDLNTSLASAYIEGFQSSPGTDGWGSESVNAMIKHWAGDGPGEGGREGHMSSGKYGVYPGGAFDDHAAAFLASLDSAATMTAYSIALDGSGDALFDDRVGAAYDTGRMAVLRDGHGYDGVVVTDWGVTRTRAWGAEDLTEAERHYAILRTGHDMFGGNNDAEPVLDAYDLWQADYEASENVVDADTRFRETGARVLTMLFQPGLYENAYLDLEESREIVASADKVAAGYQAQLDSVVLVKNRDGAVAPTVPSDWADATAYIPRTYDTGFVSRDDEPVYTEGPSLTVEAAEQHLGAVVTDEATLDADGHVTGYTAPDLSDVDVVLVGMSSPVNGDNFSSAGEDLETGEWYPLSLQYRAYTADGEHVRATSISGDLLPDGTRENRSYLGNTSRITNEADLDAFERAVAAVEASGRDIPVIALLKANNPVVPAEFEGAADAVVVGFGTSDSALVEVALGLSEPRGRLPIAFPASMDAVEAQLEDVGGDTEAYVDSSGNAWGFGFGLGWVRAVGGGDVTRGWPAARGRCRPPVGPAVDPEKSDVRMIDRKAGAKTRSAEWGTGDRCTGELAHPVELRRR
jgi:beta-glucosidase